MGTEAFDSDGQEEKLDLSDTSCPALGATCSFKSEVIGSDGRARILLPTIDNKHKDGPREVTPEVYGTTAKIVLLDPPSYIFETSSTSVSEGSQIKLTLQNENFISCNPDLRLSIFITIPGVGADDVKIINQGNQENGITRDSPNNRVTLINGAVDFFIKAISDQKVEGNQEFGSTRRGRVLS